MNSFKVGDKVIYPNQGLGVIEEIQEEDFSGETLLMYRLRLLANNAMVMIPSSCTEELGIRKPISEKTAETIFRQLRKGPVDVLPNWKGRFKEHTNRMKSGSLEDMIAVLKALYCISLQKPLSLREKKMMEKAKDLIVSEVALVSSLSQMAIEKRIFKSLSLCFRKDRTRES